MESSELNSSSENDAKLEAWLREATSERPDDGFSVRVMSVLPRRENRRSPILRWIVCAFATLVGLFVAWPRGNDWNEVLRQLTNGPDSLTTTHIALSDPATGFALVITALSLVAVFWRGRRLPG